MNLSKCMSKDFTIAVFTSQSMGRSSSPRSIRRRYLLKAIHRTWLSTAWPRWLGELLCFNMNRAGGRVHMIVSRLPPLLTDQTATVLPTERADPLTVMIPVIRKVQASRCAL